jgi:hypothetical protein
MCCVLQAVIYEDLLQINPGSATGAYSTFTDAVQPSFVLMDLDGSKVRLISINILRSSSSNSSSSSTFIVGCRPAFPLRHVEISAANRGEMVASKEAAECAWV